MTGLPYAAALEATAEGRSILMRDWRSHALGPMAGWDEGLLAALAQMLALPLPAAVVWQDHVFGNTALYGAFGDHIPPQGAVLTGDDGSDAGPLSRVLGGTAAEVRVKGTHPRWWQVVGSALYGRDGQCHGQLVQLFDITARKTAEDALRASEETLQALMDRHQRFLWRCDPAGRVVWINRLGRQFLGIDGREGAPASRWLPARDMAVLMGELQTAGQRRRPLDIHVRVRSAQQGVRWCLMHFTPLTDAQGTLHAWSGAGVDIHDWHMAASHAAHALASGEGAGFERPAFDLYGREKFCFTVDTTTGRLRTLNPRGVVQWGQQTETGPEVWADWLGRLRPEQRDRANDAFELVMSGTPAEDLWMLERPDGGTRHVHVMLFPVADASGAVSQVGGVLSLVQSRELHHVYVIAPRQKARRFDVERALAMVDIRTRRFDTLEAFAVVQDELPPGVLVIRCEKPAGEVGEARQMLSRNRQRFPWLVLAERTPEIGEVVELMRHGAATVLSPQASRTEIVAAIRAALPSREAPSTPGPDFRLDALTPRERQVLDGLLAGGTNKTIAAQLNLSPRTVEAHRAHLMDRLGARSLADLIRIVGVHHGGEPTRRAG